ncbi:ABC-type nitrate/sulfonate/bicarbonate transport system, periplasmic component [Herbaspirillum sp. CF444]|uniref:ABC transporter substrate-binding protein n=1 Tax=Herbaspirillum sp. CF444 TaxID=1144319 RepID=UPI00027278F5|nr:NrtA/SsuA/CpmA family ABC transporter substrate-binding protein [Herbaspirillum sp. CF444]EJL91288.1 ABC-type nitrate/sulfonate/bicarbonate transport system, periplasmic component [Herbaspirillum sp. CF444]
MKRPGRKAMLLSIVVVLVAGIGLWLGLRPADGPPPATESIIIATNTDYLGACPVMAAQNQGYFANHQLRVQLQPYSSGKQALSAVLSNKADMATVADIPIMFAALSGTPVQVFGTIFRTGQDHGLVARRDRGINQGSDLKGKRIGVTLTTSGHFALDVFLNRQRLDTRDVQLLNYPPDGLLQALVSGEVDAVSGWDPFLGLIQERLGAVALRLSGQDIYESIYNMVAPTLYLRQHPQTVIRLLQALEQGERFCRDQPAAASAFLSRLTPEGKAALLAGWSSHHFGLELDQSLLLVLEDQSRWAIKGGLSNARAVPNFLDYVYLDGMKAVSPSEVTIIY